MKTPVAIAPLVTDGLVDTVLRRLMSGKEADVYLVTCADKTVCAKVYKQANKRGFHKAVDYTEGRKTKNSRQARAMAKRSKYGRQEQESAWQSTEVDALRQLATVGVKVPMPFQFYEGVLLMELICDEHGQPAPRLGDVQLNPLDAQEMHGILIRQVVRMLCAGIIHGDLSEYNILVGKDGPVIIDLPQAVDAAANNNAERLLTRDVDKLSSFFGRFAPDLLLTRYAQEIWSLYQSGRLLPDSPLTGQFRPVITNVDIDEIQQVINDAQREHDAREAGRATAKKSDQ